MADDLLTGAQAIASDRDAGAAELLARLLPILERAVADGPETARAIARVVCRGQPAMAPLWHAAAAASAPDAAAGRFARVRAELERAPAALARSGGLALDALLAGETAPQIITVSFSSSVLAVLRSIAPPARLRVVCGEGRPRLEGRRLAAALHAHGARVSLATDAALTRFLSTATAVVVGADAIAATFWINKVGTYGLAAAAAYRGVPVYVVASRDKALPAGLAERWAPADGPAGDVWPDAPPGVAVANPYFETIPASLATLVLTDAGPIAPDDLAALASRGQEAISQLLQQLG